MAASSDSEDESFVEIGKPLPFVEGEGKKKPITLQDAGSRTTQDGKGRPRFHGAFTGGFSAGYFNSVGSKEGWTPSTFVSSRQQKQDNTFQKPEDFMDEEDLGEHGIAPRHFSTSDDFSSDARSRKRTAEVMSSTRDSILPASAALANLIVPDRLPIGVKLLRKMGWKEGQGVGPRVKAKKKKRQQKKGVKIYGCSLPTQSDEEDESDPSDLEVKNVTFAPKDVTPISLTSKDNVHGLGYRGLDPRSALPGSHVNLFEPPAIRSSRGRKGIRGQGFGVGALEDEDDDIYAGDSLSNYDQTMELDDSDQLFGWTAPGARRQSTKKGGAPKVPVSYVGKLLEGFSLSTKPLPPKKVYPAPTLPKGFQPFHRFKKTSQQLAQEAIGETPVSSRQSSHQKLNALERGVVLGETPIATSVFDLIPKEDKRKLEAVKEAAKMASSRFHSAGSTTETNNTATAPMTTAPLPPDVQSVSEESGSARGPDKTDSSSAPVSGVTVKPFHKDPAKQDRYDRYLVLVKQGVHDAYSQVAGSHMTEWERQREGEEFSKASKIYQPLSTMMASRFTRGTFIDDATHPTGVVQTVAEKSEEAKAAEMNMYGKLTREEMEWHPHNLLCRRFNVPNPYPESNIVGVPGLKRDKFSVFNFLSVPPQSSSAVPAQTDSSRDDPKAKQMTTSLTRELNASKRKKGAMSIFSVLEEEEKGGRKPPHSLSPSKTEDKTAEGQEDMAEHSEDEDEGSKDLFRAIFKNSDSDSSSASDKSDKDDSDDSDDEEKKSLDVASQDKLGTSNSQAVQPEIHKTSNQHPSTAVNDLTPSTPPGSPPPLPSQPPLSHSSSSQPPSSLLPPVQQQPISYQSQPPPSQGRARKASRWGVGSIFDVLDKSPPRTGPGSSTFLDGAGDGEKGEERLSHPTPALVSEEMDVYGPALPPVRPSGTGSAVTPTTASDTAVIGDAHRKPKHKHRDHDRHSSKHRHKKEKKKKSKHKKEKKKKKKSKHSHSDNHRTHSSGSEADSESDSDT